MPVVNDPENTRLQTEIAQRLSERVRVVFGAERPKMEWIAQRIGVPRPTFLTWLNTGSIKAHHLPRLASALDTTVCYLLGLTPDPRTEAIVRRTAKVLVRKVLNDSDRTLSLSDEIALEDNTIDLLADQITHNQFPMEQAIVIIEPMVRRMVVNGFMPR